MINQHIIISILEDTLTSWRVRVSVGGKDGGASTLEAGLAGAVDVAAGDALRAADFDLVFLTTGGAVLVEALWKTLVYRVVFRWREKNLPQQTPAEKKR